MASTSSQDKARQLIKKAQTEHKDLVGACISAVVAALVMAYVISVAKPGVVQLVLAILAVGAIVWAYMLVARSPADAAWKAATVVGAAVISVLLLLGVSTLLS